MKKSNTEEFIAKARKIHGDMYDYSKVVYKNAKTNICIICPVHGEFYQTPDKHLRGHKCPFCNEKKKSSTEEFIEKARKIHGDKYDYSKVEYINKDEKVCIICPEHGEFWQRAHNHLNGNGCPKCSKKHRYTTKEFVEKCKKIHNNYYDYSKTEYVSNKRKIVIVCSKRGIFRQMAGKHLYGEGCPKCSQSKMEKSVMNILDHNNIVYESQKRFNWLGQQRLDFYLPDYNIAIECQGEQHFRPVDFAGYGIEWANEKFEKNKRLDKRKLLLCERNNIQLFFINYNEDTTSKLFKILNNDVIRKHIK